METSSQYLQKLLYSLFLTSAFFLFFCEELNAQTISYFSPPLAAVGSTVSIYGSNFNSTAVNNIVYFGGAKATVITATSTQIDVAVPYGSFYQPITVTNTQTGITAYSLNPFVTVFQNNAVDASSVSLGTKTNYPSGTGAFNTAAADFDGDGKVDIAVANNGASTVSIFQNNSSNGSVSFTNKIDLIPATGAVFVTTADVDGDGKQDLICVNGGAGSISVFRNTSIPASVSFASKVDFNTGESPYAATVQDFDNDGKPDIAIINRGAANSLSVLRNTTASGTISFAAPLIYPAGNTPVSIAAGDLSSDGLPDIAVVNYFSNTLSVYKNSSTAGNISFNSKVDFATGSFPLAVAIGDVVDNDGLPDIAVANYVDNTVSVFKNTWYTSSNPASFAAKTDYLCANGPAGLIITDVDGKGGLPDIVVCSQPDSVVSVLKNLSYTSFDTKKDYPTGNFPTGLTSADFNGDGRPDMVTANFHGNAVSVLLNTSGDDAPAVYTLSPNIAASGETITINGKNFTGATSVLFGGTAASSFTVVNDFTITATVAAGASGSVKVITAKGAAALAGFEFNYAPGPERIINTIAGNGVSAYGGDGGNALSASFSNAFALGIDTARGNLFITDGDNYRIRKLNLNTGIVTTVAGDGSGTFGGDGGLAINAGLNPIQGGTCIDKVGNLYIADMGNGRIRKVDALTGIITTVAGGGTNNADGILATQALLAVRGVVVDGAGNLYIVHNSRGKIRKVDAATGLISTVVGTGTGGYNGDNIPAANAQLWTPQNITLDKYGNIYIADLSNSRIRKVDMQTSVITTVAGNGTQGSDGDGGLAVNAQINQCWSMAVDSSLNLYITEAIGNRVRMVDGKTGIITTIAGNGTVGYSGDGGNALAAQTYSSIGIVAGKNDDIFITDASGALNINGYTAPNLVRKISLFNTNASVCEGSSTSFASDVFGSTYQWQQSSDGINFSDISVADGGYTGSTSATLTVKIAYSFLYGWQYRCLVNGQPGKRFTLKLSNSWTGAAGTQQWENNANWSCNKVPDANSDVVISSGANVVINSNAACRSITVKPGASVNVNSGFNLIVVY